MKTEIINDKVVRKGKVAVAYSPQFGAGWTTWNKELSPFGTKVLVVKSV